MITQNSKQRRENFKDKKKIIIQFQSFPWVTIQHFRKQSPTIILTITGDLLRHTDTSITVVNQYLQSTNNVLYAHSV